MMSDRKQKNLPILLGLLLSLALYGAYFFNLVREELQVLTQRQGALESLKFLGVPGTSFLNDLGLVFVLKSSLFYLVLLGMLLVVLQLFSLCLKGAWHRAAFFLVLVGALIVLLHGDRVAFSFPFVTALAMGAFLFLTLGVRIRTSWKDVVTVLILGVVLSSVLFLAVRGGFFIKTRDRLLFDSWLGHRIVSYYYTYSPLAAAVISPASGVYEGLAFLEGFEAPFHHMGRGIVLSGNPRVRGAADYVVHEEDGGHVMVNRYGDRAVLAEAKEKAILETAPTLFSMEGFKTLNRISLYAFPAGLLVLPFLVLRMGTARRRAFLILSLVIGLGLPAVIGWVTWTGEVETVPSEASRPMGKGAALSLAYDLYERQEVPRETLPVVLEFIDSPSTALRYWGAKLLAYTPENPEHDRVLRALLEDPSPNVRYAAGLSLYHRIRVDSFKHLLPRLLKDPNWYVRCMLFSAFLRAGSIPHQR